MEVPDINVAIAAKGPDFQFALDTDRKWATGAQAFVNPDVTMLIFREQNFFPTEEGVKIGLKNVASIVMPTVILREFYDSLGKALSATQSENLPAADA